MNTDLFRLLHSDFSALRSGFMSMALPVSLMLTGFAFGAALEQPTAGKSPAAEAWDTQSTPLQRLSAHYTKAQLESGVYVGSEFCISCHEEYKTWKDTKHALSIRKPMTRYSSFPAKAWWPTMTTTVWTTLSRVSTSTRLLPSSMRISRTPRFYLSRKVSISSPWAK